jgi:hypothetical protein
MESGARAPAVAADGAKYLAAAVPPDVPAAGRLRAGARRQDAVQSVLPVSDPVPDVVLPGATELALPEQPKPKVEPEKRVRRARLHAWAAARAVPLVSVAAQASPQVPRVAPVFPGEKRVSMPELWAARAAAAGAVP